VTMQRGIREGLEIAVVLLLANLSFTLIVNHYNPNEDITISIGLAFFTIANCYLGAMVIKKFNSYYLSAQAICLLGMVFIILANLFMQELAHYWVGITDERIKMARTLLPTAQPVLPFSQAQLGYIRSHVFGMYTLVIAISSIGYIFTARYMQAKTFDKNILQPLYQMRADYIGIVIAIIVYLGNYFEIFMAEELTSLALLPLMLVGLSIIHHYAISHARHWLLIICFYLMFLSFPVYLFYGLVVLAGLDVFINIRGLYNGYNITRDHSRRKS